MNIHESTSRSQFVTDYNRREQARMWRTCPTTGFQSNNPHREIRGIAGV
jgi:hypothetical protein